MPIVGPPMLALAVAVPLLAMSVDAIGITGRTVTVDDDHRTAVPAALACTATAARTGYAMTWDPDRRQVVIFGGEAPGDALSGDTWGWSGTAWRCITGTSGTGPRPRDAAMLAYDARRHVLVLYGGRLSGGVGLRDTWELGSTGWIQRDSLGPTAEPHGALAWDEATGSVLLYHATGDTGPGRATWRWTGTEWSTVTVGPDEEFPDAMLPGDARHPATLITARATGTNDSFEAILYRWGGNRWVPMPATGTAPHFSPQAPAARTAGGAMLYAGFEPDRIAKSWVLEGSRWHPVSGVLPPRRKGAQMAFDPIRGVVVLHAGDDGRQLLTDTWEWDGLRWRQVPVE